MEKRRLKGLPSDDLCGGETEGKIVSRRKPKQKARGIATYDVRMDEPKVERRPVQRMNLVEDAASGVPELGQRRVERVGEVAVAIVENDDSSVKCIG